MGNPLTEPPFRPMTGTRRATKTSVPKKTTRSEAFRRLPVGAEVVPQGVHFRVWAPKRQRVEVQEPSGTTELLDEGNDYFSGLVEGAGSGDLYKYRLDGGDSFPDPASRFQPEGPHGPSQVVDPSTFPWTDGGWKGVRR